MFSQVSVCLSTGGSPHVTITHDALNITVQSPLNPPQATGHGGLPQPGPLPDMFIEPHLQGHTPLSPVPATPSTSPTILISYGSQEGDTHPTGILFCIYRYRYIDS